MSRLFLAHLSAQDPQAEHVVIGDQAGFHPRAGAVGLPANIHWLPLPPYGPELNPVEIIGDLIKDRIANTLWSTFAALEEAISEDLYGPRAKAPSEYGAWFHTLGSLTK